MIKKIIIIFLIINFFIFSNPEYKFQKDKPLNYSFQIKGTVSLNYPGTNEKLNIFIKGNLKFEMLGMEDDIYVLKIVPFKTLVKIDEQKLEDITNSETSVSSLISSGIVKMKKNGEIIEIDEVNGKILSLTQVLKLLPNFPEKVVSGKKWKQRMPAFELPGIQMCALEFNYLYLKKGNTSSIELTGIHTIKEKKKNKDITITFEGKNNSKGNFNFDEIEGKIKDFKGDFLIDLDAKFEVPPSPDVKGKIAETYTVKLNLRLNILLAELL